MAYTDAEIHWLYATEIAETTRIAQQANAKLVDNAMSETDLPHFTYWAPNIAPDSGGIVLRPRKHRGARR